MFNADLEKRFPEVFTVDNGIWQASLTTYGGQILTASRHGSPRKVIYLGEKADCSNGSAIRGGVPICWPWFGASPVAGRPIQGFARTARWSLERLEKDFCRLTLPPKEVAPEMADFPFELAFELKLSDALEMALIMKNCGHTGVNISCALHTYFAVSDCEKVTVTGLENAPYTVKGSSEIPCENAPLKIKGEICRLYCPQKGSIEILDLDWQRKIIISKENSNSTLVWNPGAERCSQIADLKNDEFHDFLCVECNRAGEDTMLLQPEREYRISQTITTAPLL